MSRTQTDPAPEVAPSVNSTWTKAGDGISTVTGITVIHGRTNVAYDTEWPGTDRWSTGIADLDYFLQHRTEISR